MTTPTSKTDPHLPGCLCEWCKVDRDNAEVARRQRMTDKNDWCEWNPAENREAFPDENHAPATVLVGADGQYRLCAECAALPRFKRLKTRKAIRTAHAPALPDEMVARVAKAMLHADGWTVQEIADQRKKGAGTTLRPFTVEILAEVALTAAGVPELLAEVERLRSGIASAMGLEEELLDLYKESSDAERIEMLSNTIKEYRKSVEHYTDTALLNGQRAITAERDGREALEFKKAINSLMEAMRLFDKEWIGDNKGWGYAFERIKLLAVERNEARAEVQRRDRLDEAELDGIAAALDGQGADSCSLSDPAERKTWRIGFNGQMELLELRRERDKALAALAKVEAWMADADDGPILRLWDNGEIGRYECEDGGDIDWTQTLANVRDMGMPETQLGCDGSTYPEIGIYREVRRVLGKEEK